MLAAGKVCGPVRLYWWKDNSAQSRVMLAAGKVCGPVRLLVVPSWLSDVGFQTTVHILINTLEAGGVLFE